MTRKIPSAFLLISLLLALVTVPPAFAAPAPVRVAAPLGVTLSFAPNPVSQGSQTQIQVSISGGTPPFLLWFNATPTIPGCQPSPQPIQQSGSSFNYPCTPTGTGTFNAHLDAVDNAGNQGSASASLTVQSGGGGGSGTGNGTGGIDLSFLQNLLPVLLVVSIVFLGSVVAIAASLVALAILVPRRLKQLRKAIQGEPLKKLKTEEPKAPKLEDQPPKDDL